MKKAKIIGYSLATLMAVGALTGTYVVQPMVQEYAQPLVKEKLNTAIRGTVSYDDFKVGWTGASLYNVRVKNSQHEEIIQAKDIQVSLSLWGLIKVGLFDRDPLEAVGTITIDRPTVHLAENEKNEWNVLQLIKPSKEPSQPMAFRGDVVVNQGTLYLASSHNEEFKINTINGVIKCNDYPEFKGALTAHLGDDKVTITATYHKDTGNASIYVDTDKLNLSKFITKLPKDSDWDFTTGSMDKTTITITKKGSHITADGTVNVSHITGRYKDYHITDGSARILFKKGKASILTSTAKINDQLFTASGEVFLDKPYKTSLLVNLVKGNLEKLLPHQEIKGILNSSIVIKGSLLQPLVAAKFSGEHISYEGSQIDKIEGELNYNKDILTFDKLIAHTDNGGMQGYGWYNTLNHSYEFMGDAHEFNLSAITSLANVDASGYINGNIHIKGKDKDIENISVEFSGKDLQYGTYKANFANGAIYGQHGVYKIPYFTANMNGGTITASGMYSGKEMNISLQGNAVPLSMISAMAGQEGQGTLNFTAVAQGTIANPKVVGSFGSFGGSIHNIDFSGATGAFTYENHELHLPQALITTGKGTMAVHGVVNTQGDGQFDLQTKVDHVRVESLIKGFSTVPITGWLSGDVTVKGSFTSPVIEGHALLEEGSAYNELIQQGQASFTYNNHELAVNAIEIKAYDSLIHGAGTVKGKNINFKLRGDDLDLERIMYGKDYGLSGKVSAEGTIQGTVDNIVFNGHIQSKSLRVNDVELTDLNGNVYYDPTVINVEDFHFKQGNGSYIYSGGLRLKTKQLFGYGKVENGQLSEFLRIGGVPIHNLDGKLNGQVDLGGTLGNPTVAVKGRINDTTIANTVMGNSIIDCRLERRKFSINKLNIPIGKGFIAAQGNATLNGEANIQLAANNVPIEYLVALTGEEVPVTGTMDGIINITGKTKDPKMQLSATVNKLNYNDTLIDHIYILTTLQSGTLKVNQILAERGKYKLKIYGKMPLAALYKSEDTPKSVDNNMDLTMDFTEADLGVLPLFTNFIEKGEGDTDGKLHFTGPVDHMQVHGDITVKNGMLAFANVKNPLQNINGALKFQGQEATLKLGATMGKGNVEVNGQAEWQGDLFNYSATMDLKGLDPQSKYFEGPINGNFTLANIGDRAKISGNLNLSNDTITIPLELASSSSSLNPLLDITISAEQPVRLYNPILYDMYVTGKATFTGSLDNLKTDGQFVAKQGTIKYLNNRFQIKSAVAQFNRPRTFLPNIDIEANTMVSNYKVNLLLSGAVEQMDLKLTSEPALSQEQILSLLTVRSTNFNTSQLEQNVVNTLVSAGLQMVVLGGIENAVQSTLGIDRFAITNNYLDPFKLKANTSDNNTSPTQLQYYSIEIGKTLLPNLMVTFGAGLNYDLTKIGFEYQINKHLGLNAWFTNDDNYFYGAKYQLQF